MNQDIINYIQEAHGHGMPDLEIKQNLLNAGWEAQIVEDNFAHLKAIQNQLAINKDEDIQPLQPAQLLAVKPKTELEVNKTIVFAEHSPAQTDYSNLTRPFYKKKSLWVSVVAFLFLASGAAGAYFFWYASPGRVWQKFAEMKKQQVLSSEFKFSYRDEGRSAKEDLAGLPFSDIKLELNGKAYADSSNEDNPQSSSEIQYSFASGNTSFSTGFEYKLIGKKLYLNVGNNPFTESVFNALGKGKKIEWVLLDLEELEKKSQEDASESARKFREAFNPQFVNELKTIWENAVFVKMHRYLGREKIGDKITLHFANSLDKDTVKTTLAAIADKIVEAFKKGGMEDIKDEEVTTIKTAANAIVDKLEIKEFETWIGMTDFRMYKVKLKTNAPSLISTIQTLAKGPREKSRDARRIADVRQMATALELYFNDKNKYPDSKDGQPLGLTPAYISVLPTAPLPSDGNCTDYFNTYWYEAKNKGASYEMTFCIGQNTGGYKSGILKLTPQGLMNVEGCPSTPTNCYKSGSPEVGPEAAQGTLLSQEEEIKQAIEKINFDAEMNIEATYNDYGVKKEVKAPEGAFDLVEILGDTKATNRDSRRLSDIRQLAASLELYFYDLSQYPQNLGDLTPKYLGVVPQAPVPPDGFCTADQNKYAYKPKRGTNGTNKEYTLDFCLGSPNGGYLGGIHQLTPAGIK